MAVFYDTHAHLDFPDFAEELDDIVARAREAGIRKIVTIGTDFESSRRSIALGDRFENVYPVVGWHPGDIMEAPDELTDELRELASQPKVAAIGETGLDYYRLPSSKGGTAEDDERYIAKQKFAFVQHLEVAAELGLNCVIHQRTAFDDTIELLAPFADRVRCVFHCFVDYPERMRRILELGSMVSFTGISTFKNAAEVRETLKATPADKFMLETDSPFLAPVPYRGKRCEPAYVKELSEFVADFRGVSLEELSEQTCATADGFFRGLKG